MDRLDGRLLSLIVCEWFEFKLWIVSILNLWISVCFDFVELDYGRWF